jgi:hypothetical protein
MKWPYRNSRPLLADRFNSFWHVAFGVLAVRHPILLLLFLVYQCVDIYDKNLLVDVGEFFIGYGVAYFVSLEDSRPSVGPPAI